MQHRRLDWVGYYVTFDVLYIASMLFRSQHSCSSFLIAMFEYFLTFLFIVNNHKLLETSSSSSQKSRRTTVVGHVQTAQAIAESVVCLLRKTIFIIIIIVVIIVIIIIIIIGLFLNIFCSHRIFQQLFWKVNPPPNIGH